MEEGRLDHSQEEVARKGREKIDIRGAKGRDTDNRKWETKKEGEIENEENGQRRKMPRKAWQSWWRVDKQSSYGNIKLANLRRRTRSWDFINKIKRINIETKGQDINLRIIKSLHWQGIWKGPMLK